MNDETNVDYVLTKYGRYHLSVEDEHERLAAWKTSTNA